MTRIAFFSPLPPETSGIADYSAELIPALASHLDLEIYTADPGASGESVGDHLDLRPYGEFSRRDAERPYDAVVYQIGNSAAHHGPIYRQLLERPGIVMLHEYMLHNLVRDFALSGSGRDEFIEAMRYCYGPSGLRLAGRLLHANNLPEAWSYPLFERVVDRAQGLIVHSEAVARRVRASRPAARIDRVRHHLSLNGLDRLDAEERRKKRREMLARHGVDPSSFVVASFGHVTASKRLDVALEGFAELRRAHPRAVYLIVGGISPAYPELARLLDGELGDGVFTTDRVSFEDLLSYMMACDVAINLRQPTGGETSGACLRLLGLGRPTLVSDVGWFAEIPAHCCAKVSSGRNEAGEIAAVLSALAANDDLRCDLGRNAARWARDEHRLEDSARGYAEAIARAIDSRAIDSRPVPVGTSPPLTPPPHDMATKLMAGIAAGLADLGLTEEDAQAHRAVAEALVDLDLDRVRP